MTNPDRVLRLARLVLRARNRACESRLRLALALELATATRPGPRMAG